MFKVLKGGVLPKIKTIFSSSADLCASEDVEIGVGEIKIIPLGVVIDLEALKTSYFDYLNQRNKKAGMPPFAKATLETMWIDFQKSHYFALKIRSSLAFSLIIANGEGEIDLDFIKQIGLIVHNPLRLKDDGSKEIDFDRIVSIKSGTPVAQIKLAPHSNYLLGDKYRVGNIREGGYGSTDTKV